MARNSLIPGILVTPSPSAFNIIPRANHTWECTLPLLPAREESEDLGQVIVQDGCGSQLSI